MTLGAYGRVTVVEVRVERSTNGAWDRSVLSIRGHKRRGTRPRGLQGTCGRYGNPYPLEGDKGGKGVKAVECRVTLCGAGNKNKKDRLRNVQ